jgi:serine/threonine protein kinase
MHLVHLDIKPDNIYGRILPAFFMALPVVDRSPVTESGTCYKIGDLSLISSVDKAGEIEVSPPFLLYLSLSLVQEGDGKYLAPELLEEEPNRRNLYKADIFSLGCSIYELARGIASYKRQSPSRHSVSARLGLLEGEALLPKIRAGDLSLPSNFSPEFVALLRSLVHTDPEQVCDVVLLWS